MPGISRRRFLRLGALALPVALGVDAQLIEPTNLCVRTPRLRNAGPHRFVHFSDFHFKGDVHYAEQVIATINSLSPEFVCFTGDLIEKIKFQDRALGFVSQIRAPVYGSPGNHEFWSQADFREYQRVFSATGGRWLVDESIVVPELDLEIVGFGMGAAITLKPPKHPRQLLLSHYPKAVDDLAQRGRTFQLILSGHSHGGQVRLPGYGAIVLPWGVGPYQLGYYETKAGPLYVSAGIGTYHLPLRFNCRPEVTVLSI